MQAFENTYELTDLVALELLNSEQPKIVTLESGLYATEEILMAFKSNHLSCRLPLPTRTQAGMFSSGPVRSDIEQVLS